MTITSMNSIALNNHLKITPWLDHDNDHNSADNNFPEQVMFQTLSGVDFSFWGLPGTCTTKDTYTSDICADSGGTEPGLSHGTVIYTNFKYASMYTLQIL